jgi:ABC-2 type transport system permease protein
VTAVTVTQRRVVTSEWIKLRTLRSTVFTLLGAVAATIGLGLLLSHLRANNLINNGFHPGPGFDSTVVSLRGVYLAQLPVGVLGVLMITGEYGTGMIRATLSAVPKRLPVLWAKAIVFAVVVFATSLVAAFLAFEGGQALLHKAGVGASLASHGAAVAVLGAALYLTVVGLIGVGLGFMIRNTAGAVATLFGLLLVLPALVQPLPTWLYNDTQRYLPMPAGTAVLNTVKQSGTLSQWHGIEVCALYAVAAIAMGAAVLVRRDA